LYVRRIETTGSRNRIHISHDTAELLHADGHSNWVRKRTTTIVAKGKGELQTFWLLTNSELKEASNAFNQDDGATMSAAPLPLVRAIQPRLAKNGTGMCNDDAPTLPPKIKRLVEWNVDVLTRLLQKIEAKRVALNANGDTLPQAAKANETTLSRLEKAISQNNFVLNEVQEIITLPTFNKDAKFEGNPNKIHLPKEVEDQLRLYVSSIAAMHRENVSIIVFCMRRVCMRKQNCTCPCQSVMKSLTTCCLPLFKPIIAMITLSFLLCKKQTNKQTAIPQF
jgi:hypothetical protein